MFIGYLIKCTEVTCVNMLAVFLRLINVSLCECVRFEYFTEDEKYIFKDICQNSYIKNKAEMIFKRHKNMRYCEIMFSLLPWSPKNKILSSFN